MHLSVFQSHYILGILQMPLIVPHLNMFWFDDMIRAVLTAVSWPSWLRKGDGLRTCCCPPELDLQVLVSVWLDRQGSLAVFWIQLRRKSIQYTCKENRCFHQTEPNSEATFSNLKVMYSKGHVGHRPQHSACSSLLLSSLVFPFISYCGARALQMSV